METKLSIYVRGEQQEVPVSLADYREAAEAGLTLPQFLNAKFPSDERHGTAFAQLMMSSGMVMAENRDFGLRSPTIHQLFNAQFNAGAIVAPDGTDRNTPSGRLLFPAVLLEMIETDLNDDTTSYNAQFMSMVAQTRTINSARYDQVVINYDAPRAARGAPISQLAEPVRMLTITLSEISRSMPVYSIGIEISKEAQRAATLDLVGLAVREQSIAERAAQLEGDFSNIINGDTDSGEAGIIGSAVTATSLDSTIASTAGLLTQKAWVKWLRTNYRRRTLTHVACDVDTYLSIEGRTGRPTNWFEPSKDERINPVPTVINSGVDGVRIFIMENGVVAANTLIGVDQKKAMRRIVYVGADYEAVQEFVLRKSTAMRIDWSERIESTGITDAFSVLTLT